MEEMNWYKKRLIKLIKSCDDLHWIKTIHRIVENLIG